MLACTQKRTEDLGEIFKGHIHLEWWLVKVEKAHYTGQSSINTRWITE